MTLVSKSSFGDMVLNPGGPSFIDEMVHDPKATFAEKEILSRVLHVVLIPISGLVRTVDVVFGALSTIPSLFICGHERIVCSQVTFHSLESLG